MYYHVIDFYFSKKSPINKHVGAHVYAHVMHTRVCVRVWVGGGGLPHHSLLCLNEAAAQLVRIPEVTICMQYIVHLQISPDGAFIKHTMQADVSMDFHTRLYTTASQGKILC